MCSLSFKFFSSSVHFIMSSHSLGETLANILLFSIFFLCFCFGGGSFDFPPLILYDLPLPTTPTTTTSTTTSRKDLSLKDCKIDILLITGMLSPYSSVVEKLHRDVNKERVTILKVERAGDVLVDAVS